ncbi:phage antirepressor N-terminal domain-containing protein [Providencia rettgeri]|uniref:Phage antirepressor Ant n=1 Tax=Providencia rettgeri TaxID=587 RepID=A0AAE3CY79_PRORE|nr:phage antirepressor N-terminal domain-containing protein [Providencia rettgeri]MBW3118922.1 phage antirepressor Ant [Providencia rettgeri]NHN53876.1 phage antirepressor Ant [Providencia rettgeri]
MNTISTINVPFHGDNLYVVNYNGEPHVPMKPIVEGMGLDWKSQFSKIKSRFSKGMVEITIPTKGGEQSMICLALRKLTGWLHTISPNKVKPEIRDKVIQYQEECDDVLYEYWTTGEVKAKPRKQVKQIAGRITSDQQEEIKQLVLNRGKALPKEKQAKAMITMWSSLKSHFGCTYKEIDSDKFTEALSLAARVPLEGEYLPKQDELPMAVTSTLTDDELLNLCYVWSDSLEMIRLMLDVSPLLQVAEHRLAPNFYEMPREAMRKANLLRRTIEKATEHIQIKRNEFSEWRILHRIRIPDMPW